MKTVLGGIRATGTLTGPSGTVSRTLDESASTGSVTGAVVFLSFLF